MVGSLMCENGMEREKERQEQRSSPFMNAHTTSLATGVALALEYITLQDGEGAINRCVTA